MSLTDILHEAVNHVHGAKLAGVIGADGLGVELVISDDEALPGHEETEIELAQLASSAALSASRLGVGNVRDIIVEAELLTYLASMITPGYYAVLGVQPNGSLGRARFAVRQMVSRLQNEL
jgi:predicted regulator of Ras-like GTPase activity (Roadblock/LC7/MglB family)